MVQFASAARSYPKIYEQLYDILSFSGGPENYKFLFDYFWKNPVDGFGRDTLEYYSGKKKKVEKTDILPEIEKIYNKFRGRVRQAEFFQTLPIFDQLINKNDDTFLIDNGEEKLLTDFDKLKLVCDSLEEAYAVFSKMMPKEARNAVMRKVERIDDNSRAIWKLINSKIRKVQKPCEVAEYFADHIVPDQNFKTAGSTIWKDFRERNPESKMGRNKFYSMVASKGFREETHHQQHYYSVKIID